MSDLATYIISIATAAMICAVIKALVAEKGAAQMITKIVCGIFLALTIISPLKSITIGEFAYWPVAIQDQAEAAAALGTQYQKQALAESIKSGTEAYILDRAKDLQVDLRVQINLSDDAIPVPESVMLWGNVSPYAKRQIQSILTTDLGIPLEDQLWM